MKHIGDETREIVNDLLRQPTPIIERKDPELDQLRGEFLGPDPAEFIIELRRRLYDQAEAQRFHELRRYRQLLLERAAILEQEIGRIAIGHSDDDENG